MKKCQRRSYGALLHACGASKPFFRMKEAMRIYDDSQAPPPQCPGCVSCSECLARKLHEHQVCRFKMLSCGALLRDNRVINGTSRRLQSAFLRRILFFFAATIRRYLHHLRRRLGRVTYYACVASTAIPAGILVLYYPRLFCTS